MRSKAAVALCWSQVVLAAGWVVLAIVRRTPHVEDFLFLSLIALAVMLVAVRPGSADARVGSLAFAYLAAAGVSTDPVQTALLAGAVVAIALFVTEFPTESMPLWRLHQITDLNAKRRVQLFSLAIVPVLIGLLQPLRSVRVACVVAAACMVTYAILRHRMFHMRVLMRRSLQYALARGTLMVLMLLPIAGIIWFLYAHRDESLRVLLSRTPASYLLVLVPLILMVRYRRRLLDALDRHYFREQYDARRVLLHVVSIVRDGSDVLGLSRVALDEIDRALHPKHASLWQLDSDGESFRRGMYRGVGPSQAPPLPASSALATLLTTDAEPLDLHSLGNRPLLARLPVPERLWLGANVAYLLVPLLFEKRLVGLIVLGERMSEEPYTREDRDVLQSLAAHLAFSFDYSRLKASPALVWEPPADDVAMRNSDIVKMCPSCGRCFESAKSECAVDHQPLVEEEGIPHYIEDKYVITRLLGRGGMGSVYLATQLRLARPVAVKVLLSHLVGSSSMRSRFEREARIVARLRHPSIVTVHDFGVLTTGHAYLVMEYLEGETLRRMIQSGPQSPEKVIEIITPVGEAIDSAHRAGIIHRDLKPENIMIVHDHEAMPSPRVLDFGLAKMQPPVGDEEATLVQSGHSAGIAGTLMYMAPEALSGRAADAKSDQYSLALITYELLTGFHPFGKALDLASVVKGHTDEPPPPMVGVPPKIADAVQRALAKKPSDRFESVGEFIEAMA